MRAFALALAVVLGACGDDDGSPAHDAAPIDSANPHTDGGIDAALDPYSTSCDALPHMFTLGPTGAAACVEGVTCRITTNTDGQFPNPCDATNVVAGFRTSATSNTISVPAAWEIVSATRGTFDAHEIGDLPTNMAVTAFIRRTSDGKQFETTFTFTGGAGLTVSKFRE